MTISTRTLIMGLAIDYHKHCKVAFVAIEQVHEEGDNSLGPRTSGAIALHPSEMNKVHITFLVYIQGRK